MSLWPIRRPHEPCLLRSRRDSLETFEGQVGMAALTLFFDLSFEVMEARLLERGARPHAVTCARMRFRMRFCMRLHTEPAF